jgi:methyl-accepting chemotaxis protein
MANKISVVIDVAVDSANRAIGGFRQQLKDTEGAAGKMKLGLSSALDFAKVNAGEFAIAAGAALVGFGIEAVGAFQDTALAAGELRDKLGLTSDDASRFIELAGDMNIKVEDLESTLGRMNRTAGESPGRFDEIGASIVRNKDGTINVRDTFLSVVDALNNIPDAALRAKAGQEIFGRSWMSIAEMVKTGADDLSLALDSIETGKVISDEEVQQARDYRDALDAMKGAVEELTIEVGGALVPVLTDAAEGMIAVKEVAGELTGIIPGPLKDGFKFLGDQVQRSLFWPQYFIDFKGALTDTEKTTGTLGASITQMADDAERDLSGFSQAYIDHAAGMRRESQETADKLTADWDRITGKISEESAFLEAKGSFQELRDAALTAWGEGAAGAETYRLKQLEVNGELATYLHDLGTIPPEKASEIIALIDRNQFDEAERLFTELSRPRSVQMRVYTTIPSDSGFRGVGTSGYSRSHTGSRFEAGEAKAIIPGEQVFVPDGPGRMYSPAESQRMMSGSGSMNMNVTVNATPDIGRDVARTVESVWWKLGAR